MLKLNQRDYLLDTNPSITVKNIPPGKFLIVRYFDNKEEIGLTNAQENLSIYKLPKKIRKDINVEISLKANQYIRFVQPYTNSNFFSEIPYRNAWAEITDNDCEYLWHGNELLKLSMQNLFYAQSKHHFLPELNTSVNQLIKLDLRNQNSYNPVKDIMLLFLSSSGKLSFEKYFSTFEQIVNNHLVLQKINNVNYYKHLSLRYLESLGHIDVDYINQKILINKPQVILIPNREFIGRQAILIGARHPDLIEEINRKSKGLKIRIKIDNAIEQDMCLDYIIPQTINLSMQGDNNDNYGEKRFKSLCEDLNLKILFNPSIFIQPLLLITSSKIDDYENRLIEDEGHDYEWARQFFNPVNLKFEKSYNDFNKDLCLLKYSFNNYNIRYKLWLNGKCYVDNNYRNKGIDPEWGRYFILHKLKRNILLFDKNTNSLAVPTTVPLPRFINKALTMMSGHIPDQKKINGTTYDVYGNLIPSLTRNIFSQLGQNIIEV